MVKINKELVFLYSENSRAKIKELAEKLGKSSQRLKYTLKAIEREGVVYNPYCIFDYSYLGLILFRVYFKGGYAGEKDKMEIIKKLGENPNVVSIYELSGEFDLAIEIESPNPSRFNKELRKVVGLVPTLNKYKIILNLVTHLYPRFYLVKDVGLITEAAGEIIIGGDREREVFSEKEMRVMRQLVENPRIRASRLAKSLGLNIKTTGGVMKDLKGRKIIRGFKYLIDTEKLGIYKFRLFLKLHNVSREREGELMEFMRKTKEIVQLNKTVGDWDMEVDIESGDKAVIRQLIIGIRENFKDLIEDFNIIEFYKYYKKSYLPRYLFGEEIV